MSIHAYMNSDRTIMNATQREAVHDVLHSLARGPVAKRRPRRNATTHDPRQLSYSPPAGQIAYQMLGARIVR